MESQQQGLLLSDSKGQQKQPMQVMQIDSKGNQPMQIDAKGINRSMQIDSKKDREEKISASQNKFRELSARQVFSEMQKHFLNANTNTNPGTSPTHIQPPLKPKQSVFLQSDQFPPEIDQNNQPSSLQANPFPLWEDLVNDPELKHLGLIFTDPVKDDTGKELNGKEWLEFINNSFEGGMNHKYKKEYSHNNQPSTLGWVAKKTGVTAVVNTVGQIGGGVVYAGSSVVKGVGTVGSSVVGGIGSAGSYMWSSMPSMPSFDFGCREENEENGRCQSKKEEEKKEEQDTHRSIFVSPPAISSIDALQGVHSLSQLQGVSLNIAGLFQELGWGLDNITPLSRFLQFELVIQKLS
jgi:hypothetical protein